MLSWIQSWIPEEDWNTLRRKVDKIRSDFANNDDRLTTEINREVDEVFLEIAELRVKCPFMLFETNRLQLEGNTPKPFVAPYQEGDSEQKLIAQVLLIYPDGCISPLLWEKKDPNKTDLNTGERIPWPGISGNIQKDDITWNSSWLDQISVRWEKHPYMTDCWRITVHYPGCIEEIIWSGKNIKGIGSKRQVFLFSEKTHYIERITVNGNNRLSIGHEICRKKGSKYYLHFPSEEKTDKLEFPAEKPLIRIKRATLYQSDLFVADKTRKLFRFNIMSDGLRIMDIKENKKEIPFNSDIVDMTLINSAEENKSFMIISTRDHKLNFFELNNGVLDESRFNYYMPDTARYFISREKHLLFFFNTGGVYAAKFRSQKESRQTWNRLLEMQEFKNGGRWWEPFKKKLETWAAHDEGYTKKHEYMLRFLIFNFCQSIFQKDSTKRESAISDMKDLLSWCSSDQRTEKNWATLSCRIRRFLLESISGIKNRQKINVLIKEGQSYDFLFDLAKYIFSQPEEPAVEMLIRKGAFFNNSITKSLTAIDDKKNLKKWDDLISKAYPLSYKYSGNAESIEVTRQGLKHIKRGKISSAVNMHGPVKRIYSLNETCFMGWTARSRLYSFTKKNHKWSASHHLDIKKECSLNWEGELRILEPFTGYGDTLEKVFFIASTKGEFALISVSEDSIIKVRISFQNDIYAKAAFEPFCALTGFDDQVPHAILIGGTSFRDENIPKIGKACIMRFEITNGYLEYKSSWESNETGRISHLSCSDRFVYALDQKAFCIRRCGRYHAKRLNLDDFEQKWLKTRGIPTSLHCKGKDVWVGEDNGVVRGLSENNFHDHLLILNWIFKCPGSIISTLPIDQEHIALGTDIEALFIIRKDSARLRSIMNYVGPVSALTLLSKEKSHFLAASQRGEIWDIEFIEDFFPEKIATIDQKEFSDECWCGNHKLGLTLYHNDFSNFIHILEYHNTFSPMENKPLEFHLASRLGMEMGKHCHKITDKQWRIIEKDWLFGEKDQKETSLLVFSRIFRTLFKHLCAPSARINNNKILESKSIMFAKKLMEKIKKEPKSGDPVSNPWFVAYFPLLRILVELAWPHIKDPMLTKGLKNRTTVTNYLTEIMENPSGESAFEINITTLIQFNICLMLKQRIEKEAHQQAPSNINVFENWWDTFVALIGNDQKAYQIWFRISNSYLAQYGEPNIWDPSLLSFIKSVYSSNVEDLLAWFDKHKRHEQIKMTYGKFYNLEEMLELFPSISRPDKESRVFSNCHNDAVNNSFTRICAQINDYKKRFLKDSKHITSWLEKKETLNNFRYTLGFIQKENLLHTPVLFKQMFTLLIDVWIKKLESTEDQMAKDIIGLEKAPEKILAVSVGSLTKKPDDSHMVILNLRSNWPFELQISRQDQSSIKLESKGQKPLAYTIPKASPVGDRVEVCLTARQIFKSTAYEVDLNYSLMLEGDIHSWLKATQLTKFPFSGELISSVTQGKKILVQFYGTMVSEFYRESLKKCLREKHSYDENNFKIIEPGMPLTLKTLQTCNKEFIWLPIETDKIPQDLHHAFHGPESPRFSKEALLTLERFCPNGQINKNWSRLVPKSFRKEFNIYFETALPKACRNLKIKRLKNIYQWLFGENEPEISMDLESIRLINNPHFFKIKKREWEEIQARISTYFGQDFKQNRIRNIFRSRLGFKEKGQPVIMSSCRIYKGSLNLTTKKFSNVCIVLPEGGTLSPKNEAELTEAIKTTPRYKKILWIFNEENESITYGQRSHLAFLNLWADFSPNHLLNLAVWKKPERAFFKRLIFRNLPEKFNHFRVTHGMGANLFLFTGRKSEIDMIEQEIFSNRNSFLLIGPRKVGKTSLLEKLKSEWQEDMKGRTCKDVIYLDFQDVVEGSPIATNVFFNKLRAQLNKTDRNVPKGNSTKDWIPWFQRKTKNGAMPFILLMDEADRLFKKDLLIKSELSKISETENPLFSWLRHMSGISYQSMLRVVMVSYQHGQQSKFTLNNFIKIQSSPLYNWTKFHQLGPWRDEDSEEFLDKGLGSLGIYINEKVKQYILRYSFNIPWILQNIGSEVLASLSADPTTPKWLTFRSATKIVRSSLAEEEASMKATVESSIDSHLKSLKNTKRHNAQTLRDHFWRLFTDFAKKIELETHHDNKYVFHVNELTKFMMDDPFGFSIGKNNIAGVIERLDKTTILNGLDHQKYMFAHGLLPKITTEADKKGSEYDS